MLPLRFGDVREVLCLGAHADDIEVGCGGTLLAMLAEHPEIDVHWSVLSATGTRAEEATAGAEAFLGKARSGNVVLRDYRDSYFPQHSTEIKEYLHDLAQSLSPDLIFTHHRNDLHQDHRLIAELTRCVFRDQLILEYEIPKYDGDLGQPNLFVPLDESICRRKVQSIVEIFRSQQTRAWFSEDTFWAMLRIRGVECNSPSRFAEGFHCRKMTASV
jgi:LmbE family N-acetylglucosaminyl deacetylase